MSLSSLDQRPPLFTEEQWAEYRTKRAMLDARYAKIEGLASLFGIAREDAAMIEQDFRKNPGNRRCDDLTKHCALTLRARKRFLSGGRKAVAA